MNEYLNIKSAAVYCGYSASYFPHALEKYKIPRYGPKKNRLKISDLDLWMKNPEIFKSGNEAHKTGFRKVQ